MKYRKEFKEQVLKTWYCSPLLYLDEIAYGYNISVSTLKRWIREFNQNRQNCEEN